MCLFFLAVYPWIINWIWKSISVIYQNSYFDCNICVELSGFTDGSVVLTKGDITRDRHSKTLSLHEGNCPITGLAFRQASKVTHMFVATLEKVQVHVSSMECDFLHLWKTRWKSYWTESSIILMLTVLHIISERVPSYRTGHTRLRPPLLGAHRPLAGLTVHSGWRWLCVFVPARWERTLLCFRWAQTSNSLAQRIPAAAHTQ